MKKAELLREALIAANTWCKANPELITVWVEKGSIETQATGEPSFMYRYTIQVLAVDFPGQVDDLMLNPDNNRKVEFDADIISDDMADVLFKVPVWERVMVELVNGKPVATHLAEDRPRINGGEWEVVFDPGFEGAMT